MVSICFIDSDAGIIFGSCVHVHNSEWFQYNNCLTEFIETTPENHVQWLTIIYFIMFNEQYEHDSREYQKAKQRASRIEKPCRA